MLKRNRADFSASLMPLFRTRCSPEVLQAESSADEEDQNSKAEETNDKAGDRADSEKLAHRLFFHFATRENLPHRAELEKRKYVAVYNERDEVAFLEKYQLFRSPCS